MEFRRVRAVKDFSRNMHTIPEGQTYVVSKDERDILVNAGLVEDVTGKDEVVTPNEMPADEKNQRKVRALRDFKDGDVRYARGQEWVTVKQDRDRLVQAGHVENVGSHPDDEREERERGEDLARDAGGAVTGPEDPNLNDMSAKDAIERVGTLEDKEQLKRLRGTEQRATVVAAIDRRIAELG